MTVDSSQFFLAFIFLAFIWVVADFLLERIAGSLSTWKRSRRFRDCHLCGKTYPAKPRLKLSRCPDCDGINPRKKHRRLG